MSDLLNHKVEILEGPGEGYIGSVTKESSFGLWVRVRSRWGHHHHPKTNKTFRNVKKYKTVPCETCRGKGLVLGENSDEFAEEWNHCQDCDGTGIDV